MMHNKRDKINVLFIPKWYPNRYDPMPGLFIQRQAETVSSHCHVAVLYVHEDRSCQSKYEVVCSNENNVHVIRVYFRLFNGKIGFIKQIIRLLRFFFAIRMGLKNLHDFRPDLLHVHVLTRYGLVALFYKLMNQTPYIITEHWSRYFPENDSYKGFVRKMITRLVFHQASAAVAVSGKLKKAMVDHNLDNPDFRIIPNPVDMDKFTPSDQLPGQKPAKKNIVHLSCFEDKSKNITGFLKAIKQISEKRNDFECILIGDGPDHKKMINLASNLGLLDKIAFFPGLKEQEDLVEMIRRADFMVLSSRYETFGSVVIESLACGIPVLATNVGIVSEVIDERNGMIVGTGDQKALENALDLMIEKCRTFDKLMIRKSVEGKYDNKIISGKLYQLYFDILDRSI